VCSSDLSTVTVCASANSCYSFVNWADQYGNVVSTSACYGFAPDNNENLVASFALKTYTVSTSSSPATGGSTSGGGTIGCGSNLTVCATPNSCYNFVDWTDQNGNVLSTSACYTFNVSSNQTMAANFTLSGSLPNSSLTNLWAFTGGSDGKTPYGGLVQANDGNFYGTTLYGGTHGYGDVFQITPAGNLSSIHSFSGSDGAYPLSALMLGSDGNLYGTTYSGSSGGGTVFRVSTNGSLATLTAFSGSGNIYYSGVIQGTDGNFYGATVNGGQAGYGFVYRVTPGGASTTLWSFTNGLDGANAYGPLVEGTDGGFYGTTTSGGSHGNGTVFRISSTGGLTNLWSFTGGADGNYPYGGLVQGNDGNFYGTTYLGGSGGAGIVYRITPRGTLTTLHSFAGADGDYPEATLLRGSDGNFYGTTSYGGAGGAGTVFRITPSGTLTSLFQFSSCSYGANPSAALIQGSDGNFYGTTQNGGVNGEGIVFRVNSGLSVHRVAINGTPASEGFTTGGGVVAPGSNVTVCATSASCYTFTNWALNNSPVSTLPCYTFAPTNNETLTAVFSIATFNITVSSSPAAGGSTTGGGAVPCGSLAQACATPNSCYKFVNWTVNGSPVNASACYLFVPTSNETLVANFVLNTYNIATASSPAGAASISGGGVLGCGSNATVCAIPTPCYSFVDWTINGNIVSTSACYNFRVTTNESLVANFTWNGGAPVGNLTNLWSFGSGVDGANPFLAGVVQGADGNFYGTTAYGGADGNGTIFRISPTGILTNLWSFFNGSDGANPSASLLQGSDGNFYGTTSGSGVGPSANGSVFRISPTGGLTNLWSFSGGLDGASPYAGLVQGIDGNFYGMTSGGGASGNGTVFRITATGGLTNLWSFSGGLDGASPYGALVQSVDGNLYGMTSAGGAGGNGTVFRTSPTGTLTNLWSFSGGVDGANPYAGLVQGGDGNLYGMTSGGGASGNGTVFRISPTGNLTNLWTFTGCLDGAGPYAGLVQGSDGNFYGTTSQGAASGNGTVFRISPDGGLTTLHFFGGSDGANPYATLVQASDGSFYGTTYAGGNGYGTVFQLLVPLNPPANQISAIQLAGGNVIVTIPSVAGETYQLQYSDSLTLSNWSNVGGASITKSIGGLLSLTNFGGASSPQGFYRFDVTP
jgi:uncharacterized repeat protein (TIGR03803 family)